MEKKNLTLPVVLLITGLVLGFLIGYFLVGKIAVNQSKTTELESLVNVAFPKPPEDLRTVVGKIVKIDGNKIEIEIGDPEDYLPHTDGTAQRTIMKTAKVGETTEMSILYPTQIDAKGNITKKELKLTDLKAGDMITVTASENIQKTKEFDTLLIEKVEY